MVKRKKTNTKFQYFSFVNMKYLAMKKAVIIASLMIFAMNAKTQCSQKEYTEKYKNGSYVIGQTSCDEKTGEWKYFDKNDKLLKRVNYLKGQLNGERSIWYPNGQEKALETWKGGKLNGVVKYWSENGTLTEESNYNEGSLEGTSEEWYENGKKKS